MNYLEDAKTKKFIVFFSIFAKTLMIKIICILVVPFVEQR